MAAIVGEAPPPMTGGSVAIPASVDRIVWRCLEKDPAARFQSCRELAFALESAVGESSASASSLDAPAGVRRSTIGTARAALPWLAAALLIGAISGATWMGMRRDVTQRAATSTRRAVFDIAGLSDVRSYTAGAVALSANGRLFVYATTGGTPGEMLRVRRFDALDSQPIDGPPARARPSCRSDGTMVGSSVMDRYSSSRSRAEPSRECRTRRTFRRDGRRSRVTVGSCTRPGRRPADPAAGRLARAAHRRSIR